MEVGSFQGFGAIPMVRGSVPRGFAPRGHPEGLWSLGFCQTQVLLSLLERQLVLSVSAFPCLVRHLVCASRAAESMNILWNV